MILISLRVVYKILIFDSYSARCSNSFRTYLLGQEADKQIPLLLGELSTVF